MEIVSRESNKVMIARLPDSLYSLLSKHPEKSGQLLFNPAQNLLILSTEDESGAPLNYSGRVEDVDDGHHVFSVEPQKKVSMKAKIAYKAILSPQITSIYNSKNQEALQKASEFEIRQGDPKPDLKPQKRVFKLHENHKSFIMANSDQALQATFRKKYKEKRVRGDPEKVREMLFDLFEHQSYWKTKALADETSQPESFLNEILLQIADKVPSGTYRGCWQLKSDYRKEEDQSEPTKKQKIV